MKIDLRKTLTISKGKKISKRDHATSNTGYESDDSIFNLDLDSPVNKKQRLTNEPVTKPQQNFHTFSDRPIEERARLPVTVKVFRSCG